jgi:membrane protein
MRGKRSSGYQKVLGERLGRSMIKELWNALLAHDVAGLAAQLSYRFALATLWLLIILAALSGFMADLVGGPNPTRQLMETAFSRSPAEVKPVLEAQLRHLIEAHSPALLLSGSVGALWTGTAGFTSVMNALNRVHAVPESRPYARRVLLGAVMTVSVGALVVMLLMLFLVWQVAGEQIADAMGVPAGARIAVRLLSVCLTIPLLMVATATLYHLTPNRQTSMRWVSPGALLFVPVWLGATFLFGVYLANFPSYANAYGAIGTLLVLFTWFFITSFSLLLGAEIDALVDRHREINLRVMVLLKRAYPARDWSGTERR